MKNFIVLLLVVFSASVVLAENVNFKNGKSVSGKVLQKDAKSLKVDVNGTVMTYYVDEIKDIDGQALVSVPVEVAKPAALVQAPVAQIKENPAEKKVLIMKFIEVFGTRRAMERNFDTLITALAQQRPQEAQQIRDKFKIDEVIERLIPLYDKHFTADELKMYIDFYGSTKGQKLVSSIGAIMRDSVEVGTNYLKEKFPEMANN